MLVGKSTLAFPQKARELPVTVLAPLCQFSRGLRERLADSHRVSHLPNSLQTVDLHMVTFGTHLLVNIRTQST